MRREFSAKVKVAAFDRAAGTCEYCGSRLTAGKFHYDHRIADAMGGEPTLDNCQVLCTACHNGKTGVDLNSIAKAKRVKAKHVGAYRKRSTFPCGRDSKWRKKIDGTVELRK